MMSSDSDNDKVSSTSKSSRGNRSSKSSKQSRKGSSQKGRPDDGTNGVIDGNQPLYLCPECDYESPSKQSVKMHALRAHAKPTQASASESDNSFEATQIDELKARRQRLELEREIKKLEDDIGKTNGGNPDHHLQQKVNELQQQLDRRDMQDLVKGFDRKFEILASRIDAMRENSHKPVQTDDRQFRDLSQMIFRLEKELQQRDSDELRRQLHILTERIEGAEKGSGRPSTYEVEASQNRDFLVYSTEIGKQVLHSLDGVRKDLHDSRREIIDAVKPFATTLGERMLGAKLQEAAKHEEYQPTERELSPEQLERLNSQLEQELGPDYLDHISEEELEDRAARELERIQEEAVAQHTMDDAEEGETDPDDVPLNDEPVGDGDDDESET